MSISTAVQNQTIWTIDPSMHLLFGKSCADHAKPLALHCSWRERLSIREGDRQNHDDDDDDDGADDDADDDGADAGSGDGDGDCDDDMMMLMMLMLMMM